MDVRAYFVRKKNFPLLKCIKYASVSKLHEHLKDEGVKEGVLTHATFHGCVCNGKFQQSFERLGTSTWNNLCHRHPLGGRRHHIWHMEGCTGEEDRER